MSKVQGSHKKGGFRTASTKDIQKSFVCNWRELQVKGEIDNWAQITLNNKRGYSF